MGVGLDLLPFFVYLRVSHVSTRIKNLEEHFL